jgi:SAM-dependent methyltransferase
MVSNEDIFSRIYRDGVWGVGSGDGSNPNFAKPYVDFVSSIVKRLEISSVLDVGHGDWQMYRDYKFEDTHYTGVDVVEGLSRVNNEKYGNKNRIFIQVKPVSLLPDAELLTCKDVLQHLSFHDMSRILNQFSKFRYLVICNDIVPPTFFSLLSHNLRPKARLSKFLQLKSPFYKVGPINNSHITTGGFRTLDLESRMFSKYFKNFNLVETMDYSSEYSGRRLKRVLFFKNLKFHQ